MRFLRTLDELLAMRSNGWACAACGKGWLDGMVGAIVGGNDGTCRHPKLIRALIGPAR